MDDKSALTAPEDTSPKEPPIKEKSPGSFKEKIAPAQTGTSGSQKAGSLTEPPTK